MKKFILPFFVYSTLLMGVSYGLIVAIDPYDKLGNNLFGFETKAVASSRENKFYMLERTKEKYEAFILGSSTAHRYNTSDVERLTGFKTFNYAVQHTSADDYVAILNHIKSKFKPKLVILQISFSDLDVNHLTDKRLGSSPLGKFSSLDKNQNTYMNSDVFSNDLLTLDALRDSFRVIGVNVLGETRHVYLEHGNYKKESKGKGKIKLVQFSHKNWKLDISRVELFKKIQLEADEVGIELVVISAPLAPIHLRKIKSNTKMRSSFEMYKKIIFSTFKNVKDFSTEEMNKYNTTEYFRNSTHPSKKLSKIILEQIWSHK
jgi:hypothetical protein